MIAEYSVNLQNRTKQELITMIEDAQKIISKQQKEIKDMEKYWFENKQTINVLTMITAMALNGRTMEVSKKTLYELQNTMKIEQIYIPETDSYRIRAK